MFDLSELSIEELLELKDILNEISNLHTKKLDLDLDFYNRILQLKEQLSLLEGKPLALNIDGEDIFIRFEFNQGFNFSLDELDATPCLDIDEYNENGYEQLYIHSNDGASEIENFYIPLYCDFIATTDPDTLKDSPDEVLEYDNVAFIIRMDSINYIFTNDIEA